MFVSKRILVPVDFTDKSRSAMLAVAQLTEGSSDTLVILCHILPVPSMGTHRETVPFHYIDDEREVAFKRLEEWRAFLPDGVRSQLLVDQSPIADAITRLCHETRCDLIVMTTAGRRGLSRMLKGSTTEETVRLAPCPVLVLHLNDKVQDPTRRLQALV